MMTCPVSMREFPRAFDRLCRQNPSIAAATWAAAAWSTAAVTWEYASPVIPIPECPSRSLTTFSGTPASSACVACPWSSAWSFTTGSRARLRLRLRREHRREHRREPLGMVGLAVLSAEHKAVVGPALPEAEQLLGLASPVGA